MLTGLLVLIVAWIGTLVVINEQSRCKIVKYIYGFYIIMLIGQSIFLSYAQFQLWRNNQLAKYFLPPYRSINYFLEYTFFRHWSHFLAALIFSLIILFLAKYFNNRRGGRYFYDEEPYFLAIAILAVGYPGWLVYFTLMLLVPTMWSAIIMGWRRLKKLFELGIVNKELGDVRTSYYYLWLPLAVGAILINMWLVTFSFWSKLII